MSTISFIGSEGLDCVALLKNVEKEVLERKKRKFKSISICFFLAMIFLYVVLSTELIESSTLIVTKNSFAGGF